MRRAMLAVTLCCAIASSVACGNSPTPAAGAATTPPVEPASKAAPATTSPKADVDPKASAEAAIKSAVDAYAPVKSDAEKYLPDQAASIDKMLASLQLRLEKADFAAALSTAQLVKGMITALDSTIQANKSDLAAWAPLAASIPPMLVAATSRVEELKASSALPEGLTKDGFERARADLRATTRAWDDALRSAALGTYPAATQKANDVKLKLTTIMAALKMQEP